MSERIDVQSVTFMQDGIVVQYMDLASDVRVKGALVRSQQLSLSSAHPDYRDDIEALHSRVVRVLKNALEDFEDSDPVDPETDQPDEDEEARGMGYGT